MKLKQKLAIKYRLIAVELWNKEYKIIKYPDQVIEEAFLAGFDRAKELYIDYAKRFLSDPNLKPGPEHEKHFQNVGEQPGYANREN